MTVNGQDTSTVGVTVDVVSDVMCPWCHVGRARLKVALRSLPDTPVAVRWRPFQLDPTLPPEGKDRTTYLREKFGSEDRATEMHRQLEQIGSDLGIRFDFAAIRVSPNTLDAHRVIRWAATSGLDVQDRLVGRLFELYFEEGADIGSHAVLTEAAEAAGMERPVVEVLLAGDADREAVQEEIATAQQMGVTGVPCFLIERRYAVMGAQEPDALASAISQVAEAKANGTLETPPG